MAGEAVAFSEERRRWRTYVNVIYESLLVSQELLQSIDHFIVNKAWQNAQLHKKNTVKRQWTKKQ